MPATTIALMVGACAAAVLAATIGYLNRPAVERRRQQREHAQQRALQRAAIRRLVAGELAVKPGTWETFVAAHGLRKTQEA